MTFAHSRSMPCLAAFVFVPLTLAACLADDPNDIVRPRPLPSSEPPPRAEPVAPALESAPRNVERIPFPAKKDGLVLDTSFGEACGIYRAETRDALPRAIRWESCPASVQPAGIDCQVMTIDWPKPVGDWFGAGEWRVGRSGVQSTSNDHLIVGLQRNFANGTHESLIADITNGEVRAALRSESCEVLAPELVGDRYIMPLPGAGAFVGWLGDPAFIAPTHALRSFATFAYPTLFGAIFDEHLVAWSGEPTGFSWVVSNANKNHRLHSTASTPDMMFFSTSNPTTAQIRTYTPEQGVRLLRDSAGTLRTDGHDMVWLEGVKDAVNGDHIDLMTSPYATEAAAVAPRRVRTMEPTLHTVSFPGNVALGCGFVAIGQRINRLRDGHEWILQAEPPTRGVEGLYDPQPWSWLKFEGPSMSCDEALATVLVNAQPVLVRVKLASLGITP